MSVSFYLRFQREARFFPPYTMEKKKISEMCYMLFDFLSIIMPNIMQVY